MIPIRTIVLEGTDLSGKTSLYRNLHKTTQFKYNVQDRSALSMLCYAKLYGRDEAVHRTRLMEEICDANNFIVILMLPLDVILRRFHSRGDEAQDESSLAALHHIFSEEASRIEGLPNVLVIRQERDKMDLAALVAAAVRTYEQQGSADFGSSTSRWCQISPMSEVQLRVSFDVDPGHFDPTVMSDEREGEYYSGILRDVFNVIVRETSGDNPYGVPQGVNSRRFYYHSDTCISSIHFLPRDGQLKVLCTLRSTDSVHNGELDLRFLTHLSAVVARSFPDWCIDEIALSVSFNSLHVRLDTL